MEIYAKFCYGISANGFSGKMFYSDSFYVSDISAIAINTLKFQPRIAGNASPYDSPYVIPPTRK